MDIERTDKVDKVKEITDEIKEKIQEFFESDKYKDWLRATANFTNYSLNNTILIATELEKRGESLDTHVAGMKAWNRLERSVDKGAKGIPIIQPAPYKKTYEVEAKDSNGNTILNDDGTAKMEEVERTIQVFKVGYIFTENDTHGEPIPEIVSTLDAKVDNFSEFMDVLKTVSDVSIEVQAMGISANGYYSQVDKSIYVKDSLPELQQIKTTLHEMAHYYLHDKESGINSNASKNEKEVEAESVAYTVCNYYGLDTSDYSFGYISGWAEGKDLKELTDSMEQIRSTAKVIIDKVDGELSVRRLSQMDELAYKVGADTFIISANEEGYDYGLYNDSYELINAGSLSKSDSNIVDAAKEGMRMVNKNPDFATLKDSDKVREKIRMADREKPEAVIQQEHQTHHIRM